MKKVLISTVVVFIAWALMDMLIHMVILQGLYEETKALWRPMEEMKMGLGYVISIIVAFLLSYIYYKFVGNKSVKIGLTFGLLLGLMWGLSMGYGTYTYMPIPYMLALGWFLATTVEMTITGIILGAIIKE